MGSLSLHGIRKSFGQTEVLKDVSITINRGEFFSLLGPSGCGKSTLLRIIAGLDSADSGEVSVDGQRIDKTPPQSRGIGMVFQQYALWPHMTVGQNVRFGVDNLPISRSDREKRVSEALSKVQMQAFANRYPHEISGGQQQRVALARALAMQPSIILLDEPLSNLDARLRAEICDELRELHRELGTTMIYVTHDQQDALALSSRLAVMSQGHIVQVGSPRDLYDLPASPFVAKFLGDANLLPCTVSEVTNGLSVTLPSLNGRGAHLQCRNSASKPSIGTEGFLCVRPAAVRVSTRSEDGGRNVLHAHLRGITYRGADYVLDLELSPLLRVRAHVGERDMPRNLQVGETVATEWSEDAGVFVAGQ